MNLPRPSDPGVSPSLAAPGGESAPAFEIKFLLTEALAAELQDWAAGSLRPDPHADPGSCGSYQTTSLYLDTPEADVYHRRPPHRRRKYRVRRYGSSERLFLERKTKSGDRVRKRRVCIDGVELPALGGALSLESWPGHWFHQRLVARDLRPASRMTYRRTALVGACAEGPLRLTLDRDIFGVRATDWSMAPPDGGLQVLPGHVIMELKFLVSMPLPFKQLMHEFKLTPVAISKYRLCRAAWEAVPLAGEAARA